MTKGGHMSCRLRTQWVFAGMLALSLFVATAAKADELYGRVRGVVTDSSGAAMPGVPVKLTNTGTGIEKVMTTGSDGGFLFVNLIPGTYNLNAAKAGFKVYEVHGITV